MGVEDEQMRKRNIKYKEKEEEGEKVKEDEKDE